MFSAFPSRLRIEFVRRNAIILGGFVNGLGLVRSMAAIGVSSIVIDTSPSLAGRSKTAREYLCPDPTERENDFVEFMIRLGEQHNAKPVIFATNDQWLFPILKRKRELEGLFIFPMSEWGLVEACLDKEKMYGLAGLANVLCPLSLFPKTTDEITSAAIGMTYPCIIKPATTVGFDLPQGWNGRSKVANNPQEVFRIAEQLDAAGHGTRPIIMQEQIPGGTESLYTFTSYSNKDGDVLAWSTGYKIRQYPPEAGTITAGRVSPNRDLEEQGKRFIKSLGFYGIANTEFKKDARDGLFKLIEINPRPGMWNLSALKTGVNLPALAYLSSVGGAPRFSGSTDASITWVFMTKDFLGALHHSRKTGRLLSLVEWWRSLHGKKIDAVASLGDPIPFMYHACKLSAGLLRLAFQRILAKRIKPEVT